jgi:hypothetical protein
MGDGLADFSKNLRASPFNTNLSIDTTFSQIHLARQWLLKNLCCGVIGETRERLPLLTVETNWCKHMGTYRVQMKGVHPWLVRWARRAGTIFFPLLWLLSLAHIIFLSPCTISIDVSPSPSKLGRQSCRATCLWMCVSGCDAGQIVIYLKKKKREKKRRLKNC